MKRVVVPLQIATLKLIHDKDRLTLHRDPLTPITDDVKATWEFMTQSSVQLLQTLPCSPTPQPLWFSVLNAVRETLVNHPVIDLHDPWVIDVLFNKDIPDFAKAAMPLHDICANEVCTVIDRQISTLYTDIWPETDRYTINRLIKITSKDISAYTSAGFNAPCSIRKHSCLFNQHCIANAHGIIPNGKRMARTWELLTTMQRAYVLIHALMHAHHSDHVLVYLDPLYIINKTQYRKRA